MGEAERGDAAPRHRVSFYCARGHETHPELLRRGRDPGDLGLPPLRLPGRSGPGEPADPGQGRAVQDPPGLREGAPLRRRRRRDPGRGPPRAAPPGAYPVTVRDVTAVNPGPPHTDDHWSSTRRLGGRRRRPTVVGVLDVGERGARDPAASQDMRHRCYGRRMVEVASRDLRNDTAGVLKRVQSGEDVVITIRGKPVARLVPVTPVRRRWLSRAELAQRLAPCAGGPRAASRPRQAGW